MHKADASAEAGIPPTPELVERVGELIGKIARSGAFLGGEGLQPSSMGVRLNFSKGKPTITPGPFKGSNELVSGLAIVRARSINGAVDYATRVAAIVGDAEIDVGVVKEAWDIGLGSKPDGEHHTRYMILHKADAAAEAGRRPASGQLAQLARLNSDTAAAGVLLMAESLAPSAKATRLRISRRGRRIKDGPFAESKELIGGYCMIQVQTRDEAIDWGTRLAGILADARETGEVEMDIVLLNEPSARA